MNEIKRQSAVQFDRRSAKTEARGGWEVVLQYHNEGKGPWLVDLAHIVRFDLQDKELDSFAPGGITVPSVPGQSVMADKTLISRMNGTQASIYYLDKDLPVVDEGSAYTEITENTVFLALFGPGAFHVAEKLTALDFLAPDKEPPFLYQGPFCHVPCQIITLEKTVEGSGGILLSCSRGYAESMVHAILDSGAEFGLRPAGEEKFTEWIERISTE